MRSDAQTSDRRGTANEHPGSGVEPPTRKHKTNGSVGQLRLNCSGMPNPRAETVVAQATPPSRSRRTLGAYYTPEFAAHAMAAWAVRTPTDHVLEPSMGEGVFVAALQRLRRERVAMEITAVEYDHQTFQRIAASDVLEHIDALHADFMEVPAFRVDAVVGNPPYVRLRHLPKSDATRALNVAQRVLGKPMDPSGSLWMPFVLHALEFLKEGGRLALVLPYEMTYVRYAKPLWQLLSDRFGSLAVHRVKERLFPSILQEAVVFYADNYGASTDHVSFSAYGGCNDFVEGRPHTATDIDVAAIRGSNRPFLTALLPPSLASLLVGRVATMTVPARELVTFNIGYVCGDKKFFHPTSDAISAFGLPEASLRPALAGARQLRGAGLRTSQLNGQASRLFLPSPNQADLSEDEWTYIRYGKEAGVASRYKCRIRRPWYVTPGVRVPDLVLPVFSERPFLVHNDAGFVASNSLLCGFIGQGTSEDLLSAWYTSLTLLQLELQIHALGGGVLVVVPREAGNLRVPRPPRANQAQLQQVDRYLRADEIERAFAAGDSSILRGQLNMTMDEIELIRHGRDVLAAWRTGARISG